MGHRGTNRLWRPLLACAGVLALTVTWLPATVTAQEPGDPIEARAFATGMVGHVTALEMGGTRLEDTEVAFSGASVDADADGLSDGLVTEVNRVAQPGLNGKNTYARGSGLEVGLGVTVDDENQVIVAGKAEADAPPTSSDTQEIGPVEADPLAFASVAKGDASARWNETGLVPGICVLGDDLSRGLAHVADARLLNAGTAEVPIWVLGVTAPDPERSVSQSLSRTRLVSNGDGTFGLMSEVRQTIAPIAIQAPDGSQSGTIELLGEWVLRVVATGKPGGASVHYGPGEVSPETPILRIIQDGELQGQLIFQDVFGEEGFTDLDIPGLLTVAVGEDPRAIAAPGEAPDPTSSPEIAGDGTSASAAVDVLRVELLDQPDFGQAADIRIGHMETSTQVPAGGIQGCDIPVQKTADPENIQIGGDPDTSRVSINVINPYTCELNELVVTDEIRQDEGSPDFQLTAANPEADSPEIPSGNLTEADVVWSLGTLAAESSTQVTVDVKSATQGGVLEDIATADAVLGECDPGTAVAGFDITGIGITGVSPQVKINIETPRTGAAAASTVVTGSLVALLALGLSFAVRRRVT